MIWREIREADLAQCFKIEPGHLGDEIVGCERAIQVWKDLIRSRSFNSCVIESAGSPGRILAFGASVFVTPEFATREIEQPEPCLNGRIIASIANGKSVVRAERELYGSKGGEPLDLAVLAVSWPDELLSPEELQEVQMLLAVVFVEAHTGYRLNRLFLENVSRAAANFSHSSGVWREQHRFADSERSLSILTRESALAVSGSLAISLFQYQEPV